MESLHSSTSVAASPAPSVPSAQANPITYNAAIAELSRLISKHQGTYNDPLSARLVVWHKSTMTSLSNLKKNGAAPQELECGLHESINNLRQEILVNPLDGSRLKQPYLQRNWVWEGWMHEDCITLSPNSPLDNEPINGATPHEFAADMLAWSEKNGLPVAPQNGSAAQINQKHMEFLAKQPRFTAGRRSVYTRVCRAAQIALSTSFKQIVAREAAMAEKEVLTMLESAFIAVTGDAVRGTVLISNLAQIPALVNYITKVVTDLGGRVHAKNFFENPKSSGYVAVHLILHLPIPGCPGKFIIVEMQIHDEKTMDGSESCVKEVSHGMYKPRDGVLDASIVKKFEDAGKLLFSLKMIDLCRAAKDPKSTVQSGGHLELLQKIAGVKDEKISLAMQAALFLHKEGLEGDYDSQFGVVIPRNREVIHAKWLAAAKEIAEAIKLAASPKGPSYSWTNTATSVDELLADAGKIAPFFEQLCRDAAGIHGCRVNFGPEDAHMIKKVKSLREKVNKDINEAMSSRDSALPLPPVRLNDETSERKVPLQHPPKSPRRQKSMSAKESALPVSTDRVQDPAPRLSGELKTQPNDEATQRAQERRKAHSTYSRKSRQRQNNQSMSSQECNLPFVVDRLESPKPESPIDTHPIDGANRYERKITFKPPIDAQPYDRAIRRAEEITFERKLPAPYSYHLPERQLNQPKSAKESPLPFPTERLEEPLLPPAEIQPDRKQPTPYSYSYDLPERQPVEEPEIPSASEIKAQPNDAAEEVPPKKRTYQACFPKMRRIQSLLVRCCGAAYTTASPRRILSLFCRCVNTAYNSGRSGSSAILSQWKTNIGAAYSDRHNHQYLIRRVAAVFGGIIGGVTSGSVGAVVGGVCVSPVVNRVIGSLYGTITVIDVGTVLMSGLGGIAGGIGGAAGINASCEPHFKSLYPRCHYPVSQLFNVTVVSVSTAVVVAVFVSNYNLRSISSIFDAQVADVICIATFGYVFAYWGGVVGAVIGDTTAEHGRNFEYDKSWVPRDPPYDPIALEARRNEIARRSQCASSGKDPRGSMKATHSALPYP